MYIYLLGSKFRSQALYARLPRGHLVLVSPVMTSSPSEDNKVSSASPAPDRQCERLASTDGDVIVLRSIDHVLFNVHRVNLRVNTTGPFSEDFHAPKGDVADLTEDAETLELLFSFVYAKQHRTLSNLPFGKQLRLAEAAEKYGVVPAMTVCRLLFEYICKDHPLEILVFAYTHHHLELLDACASRVIGTPIKKVYAVIPSSLYHAWVLISGSLRSSESSAEWIFVCTTSAMPLKISRKRHIMKLPSATRRLTMNPIRSGTCKNGHHTGELRMVIQSWTSSLRTRIASLPSLSSFLLASELSEST
ncbi:hypothetical protein GGG16DRAFT_128586 [Schizophyllum commune]